MNSSRPSSDARFATTHWSLILEAGGASPDAEAALAELCETYWYPLYAYVRRRGFSSQDAQDATQAFLAELLEKRTIDAADQHRGRFRAFLLTVFKRFLARQHTRQQAAKRGGQRRQLSLDFDHGERQYQFEPFHSETPEAIYQRRWALALLEHVLERLEAAYDSQGKRELFSSCRGFLLADGADASYTEIAEHHDMTPGAVRVAVHRMREKYQRLIRESVSQTVATPEEVDDEIRALQDALRQS